MASIYFRPNKLYTFLTYGINEGTLIPKNFGQLNFGHRHTSLTAKEPAKFYCCKFTVVYIELCISCGTF